MIVSEFLRQSEAASFGTYGIDFSDSYLASNQLWQDFLRFNGADGKAEDTSLMEGCLLDLLFGSALELQKSARDIDIALCIEVVVEALLRIFGSDLRPMTIGVMSHHGHEWYGFIAAEAWQKSRTTN
jgi:hypothetical protein